MVRCIGLPPALRGQARATGRVTAASGKERVGPCSQRGRQRFPRPSQRSRSSVLMSRRILARQCAKGCRAIRALSSLAPLASARGCIRSSRGLRCSHGNGFASLTWRRRRCAKPKSTSSSSHGTRSHTRSTGPQSRSRRSWLTHRPRPHDSQHLFMMSCTKELFSLRQGQPEMLDASVVLVEGDHIGDSLFITLIATHDELKLDMHTGAHPGSSGR